MTIIEELKLTAEKGPHQSYDQLLLKAATEIETLYKQTKTLCGDINELRRQNAELRECLKVKDESLRYLQRVFDKALAAQPEGGAK